MFSAIQQSAINELSAPESAVDFLLCALPQSDQFTLYADKDIDGFTRRDANCAMTGTFAGDTASFAIRYDKSTAFSEQSTDRDAYRKGASAIIGQLHKDGGKTVYSRVISGITAYSPLSIACRYFQLFSDTFRFMMRRGDEIWIGASPELLVDNDPVNGRLHTAALAGTRPVEFTFAPWDSKNIEEHRIVVDFIVDTLSRYRLEPHRLPTISRRFGIVEHLFTPITASACCPEIIRHLLSELSPTPALLGWPREVALDHLSLWESHDRGYYGGFIAVEPEIGRTIAYVNLRSVRLRYNSDGTYGFNIYVGGGLTAGSDIDSEWDETERKSRPLLNCILN